MISSSSSTASSAPATSANVVLGVSLRDDLGLGLAELHDAGAAALHLVHHEEEQDDEQDDRQQVDQQRREQALRRVLAVVALRRARGR